MGRKRTRMITEAWEEQRAIKEVMLFLQSYGVTTSLATKIYKYYGDDAITIVRRIPTGWHATSTASASSPPTRSHAPWVWPRTTPAPRGRRRGLCAEPSHRRRSCLPAQQRADAQAAELLGVAPEQTTYGILDLWRRRSGQGRRGAGRKRVHSASIRYTIGRNAPVDRRAGHAVLRRRPRPKPTICWPRNAPSI